MRSPAIPQFSAITAIAASAAVAMIALLAAFAPATSALSSNHGASFAVRCDFSDRASVDPIRYPYPPGNPEGPDPNYETDSHSHDFFGNNSTDYDSTYESMIAASTTCTRPKDTAAYWFPTAFWNGQLLQAHRAVFYYRAGGKDHEKVKPYPPGLKVIAASPRRISWSCGQKDTGKGSRTPPSQCDTGTLGVRIIFPDCSNGKIDSTDHRSHMAYSSVRDGKRRCPRSHRRSVPQLTINANFTIGRAPGKVTLSCDEGECGPSTMHADFWNTWDQAELDRLVVSCINDVPYRTPRPPECQASPPPP